MDKRPFEEGLEWILQQINQMDIEDKHKYVLIGMVTALEAIHNETVSRRILCMNCQHHRVRTQRCDIWMENTPPDGHCYRANVRADRSET